jgi:DNA helicase-2/ATP-dependent DNA helicase PcrA
MPHPELHPAVAERLARLAPDQRAAATAPPGPVLCVAPAGSGKTATLVARISWLVTGPERLDPATICAVTFNRRAADELRSRVDAALRPAGIDLKAIRVRTFHALGREILADAGVDVTNLVAREAVLAELFPGAPPGVHRHLDDAFSRLKLDLRVDPRTAAGAASHGRVASAGETASRPHPRWLGARVAGAFLAYQERLRAAGALDFDDLVVRALELLRSDGALRLRWRTKCAHLLVDEVQDVDRSQLDLAVLLAGDERRIFLVGDDDQTIYAWRLADVRRVISLAARLPGLRRVDLTVNYRCPAPVVARAVRLVAHNRERFRKRIAARAGATGSLSLAALPSDDATRARRILGRWVTDGLPRDEDTVLSAAPAGARWAVLARTNAELAPYAAVALEMGIAFSAEEHGLLLDDPRVDTLLDAAGSLEGPESDPLRALGATALPGIDAGSRDGPSAALVRSSLLAWAAPFATLASFREALAEARRRLQKLRRDDAPLVLATVHGTKGLEFDHVAVVGLDEGRFPSRRSLEEATDPARALEEERRLAYVAWTRAKRSLVLVYDPGAPSPFLREAFSRTELVS